jgi:hypothetical protein
MNGLAPLAAALALAQAEPAPEPSPPPPAPRHEAPATRAPDAPPAAVPPVDAVPQTAPRRRLPAPDPAVERAEGERAARAFLEALAARDADALAQAAGERFSFDGEPQAGREAIRRTWRGLLAGREGPSWRVGQVEVLAAADAIARLGKPPTRIAPLARPGALVAVGDVGGRAVVLFLAREGGRMAVLGMHD